MNFSNLCSRLNGLTLETGKLGLYWLRMQGYNPRVIMANHYGSERDCNETFFQAILNVYINNICDPNRENDRENVMSYRDFLKTTYPDNSDAILTRYSVQNNGIGDKYALATFAKRYVDEYLQYLNNSNFGLFEYLKNNVLNKLMEFVQNVFNVNFPTHAISRNELQYLEHHFKLLADRHNNMRCLFSQPWPSAIYVRYA